jgi:epoxide hydrolase-like predicted phosphatase
MTFRAIIFDLGGVFVELDISEFFQEVFSPFSLARPKVPFMLKFFKQSDKYHMGEMDNESFYHLSCDILKLDKSKITQYKFFKAFNMIINGINKNMVDLLKRLYKTKLYRLICLSNVNTSHWDYLNRKNCKFLKYFDEIILSHKVHLMKPARRIFELAIDKAQCDPQEIVYIDDGLKNIKSAEELGIVGIVFNDYPSLIKDFEELGILFE